MVNTMLPVAVLPVQLVPVYQVRVPALPEEAVNRAPVVTPLPLPSSRATVITLAEVAHRPAVKVRGLVAKASCEAAPATTISLCVLLPTPAATVITGLPGTVSS